MTMKLTTREITVFAMLGAVMYASKLLMELVPNVHLLGTFIIAFTVVYRKKALYPIYIYVQPYSSAVPFRFLSGCIGK